MAHNYMESFDKPEKTIQELAEYDIEDILKRYNSSISGLSDIEAKIRFEKYGPNVVIKGGQESDLVRFLSGFREPLIILLMIIAVISFAIKELETSVILIIMILISILLTFFQETRSNRAAEKLQEMVRINTNVVRQINGRESHIEIPISQLVPGDIVHLTSGNIIPADIRLISSKNLYINQSALTGESMPVEKQALTQEKNSKNPLELANMVYMGSYVSSGTATGLVLFTGKDTYFGEIASNLVKKKLETTFNRGVHDFTWLMIKFMLVSAPLVFLVNGISKGDWLQALLFSLAVIVALTPEMMPVMITVNLAKGALELSKNKVIVKQLSAIQNLGAMNILCSDKTGTLTQNKVILERHINIHGEESEEVLKFAYINSFYQAGLKNLLDEAIFEHIDPEASDYIKKNYIKIDEIPFDFSRRRVSVIAQYKNSKKLLVCKGAVEEVLNISNYTENIKDYPEEIGNTKNLEISRFPGARKLTDRLNNDGFRVLAVAYKELPFDLNRCSECDETDLTLIGFVAFLDPPKESVAEAIAELNSYGVEIKILTGDNELVTQKVCREVGLNIKKMILGSSLDGLSENELAEIAKDTTIFAKLSPMQKERVIKALREKKNVVGYLGDGINDAPSLKAADVGISVNTAVDIAKESADIILLEKSLLILGNGVIEGRKVFANVMKYIHSRASIGFGNMLSIVISSAFLPFLPMLPIQIIINNLLSDFSNTTVPTDNVDPEYLKKPKTWEITNIRNYMTRLGFTSSFFDFILFFTMILVFSAWTNESLFQTGWFTEFIIIQILMIYVVRTNKISFINSDPSPQLILSHIAIIIFAFWLPYSPLSEALGFIPLPKLYYLLLILILLAFVITAHIVKTRSIRNSI